MPLLLLILLLILPTTAIAQDGRTVDLAIVTSLDRSESVDEEEAKAQIEGLIYAIRNKQFRDTVMGGYHGAIALSVVTWSSFGRHETILPWIRIANGRDAERAAALLRMDFARQKVARHGSQTDLAFGIEVGVAELERLPFAADQKVINLVTDGVSNIGHVATVDRDIARDKGITINGLIMAQGYAIEVLTRYFKQEVLTGATSFVQLSKSKHDFADAMLRKMLLEMVRLRVPRRAISAKAG